jgi:N-hydroxyarylamine O-acetyltransferase
MLAVSVFAGGERRAIPSFRLSKIFRYLVDNILNYRLSDLKDAVNDKARGAAGSGRSPRSRKARGRDGIGLSSLSQMLRVPAYLDRIAYSGPLAPTAEVLRDLHRAHLLSVPFENLDIALGRKIVCDENAFVRKIVNRRRGGFCYELNGAFAGLLRAIGFKVTLLSARVPREDGRDGPEFDHLALRIDLQEPWPADVGFGDSFLEPLELRGDIQQSHDGWTYRVVDCGEPLCVERAERDGAWKRQYSFTPTPRSLNDFAAMCHYHQTSPASPFTRKSVCSMATPEGRITVADRKLIFTRNGKREERLLASDAEWRSALKEHFNIVL